MKEYQSKDIKNIVLVGSSKSGKTTLAECMMFEGGVISRMGKVEDRNTVSDYHEIEQERQNSIFSSVLHTEWRGSKINIIDTPGLDDFIGETVPSLRVADTALVVLNAQNGVEVGTEIIWRYLEKYHKPSLFVVNQVDHPKADFQSTLEMAQRRFGSKVIAVQYPYNPGEGFNAIIDLLKMVMYEFPPAGGKPEKKPIPASERARADELHNRLVEAAAENDENLMELYFEKGELDEDEMRKGIRIGMLKRDLFPLFCVASRKNMGSGRLMGFIGNVAPTAEDMGPEHTTEGNEIKVSDKATTLFVFKSSHEKHAGSMSFFKVCSGTVRAGDEFYNNSSRSRGKMNQLYSVDGKNRNPIELLHAGDIGATVKFKDTFINQTLRPDDDGVIVDPIVFPDSKIQVAVSAKKQGEEEKMSQGLHRLSETDPTLLVEYAKELRQTILHSQGELHLTMIKWQMEHDYGVEIEYQDPRISYRETIQSGAISSYRHKKQSGGSGQFGEVHMRVMAYTADHKHPAELKVKEKELIELPWGGHLLFCNCIVGGAIDNRFLPAILKGVMENLEEGPLTGSYVRDVAVYVFDGKMHPVDSNEISFKIAGTAAFKQAFLESRPKLMEPIYKLEVLTPTEFTGDVMTDLTGRRAVVEGFENEFGDYQRIVARLPLAEMGRYATALSSFTQGRATFNRRFLEYAQVPSELQASLTQTHSSELVN